VLGFDPGAEPVFQVGVLVGQDVPLNSGFGSQGDDGELAVGTQRDAVQEPVHRGLDLGALIHGRLLSR
jgi:hypothetical protein